MKKSGKTFALSHIKFFGHLVRNSLKYFGHRGKKSDNVRKKKQPTSEELRSDGLASGGLGAGKLGSEGEIRGVWVRGVGVGGVGSGELGSQIVTPPYSPH